MTQIHVTNLDGETRTITAEEGLSLMENLRENDFDDLQALCGGCCSCCTCHIYVEGDKVSAIPPMEDDEENLLEDSEHFRPSESRLSCQIEVTDALDGLSVTIVPE